MQSHVQSWDEHCGWTKLRLFELDSYDTILYIDADCLVVKDVSHLLQVDKATNSESCSDGQIQKQLRTGLLAAAPDIFPPDKFNAGVMVLRPSKSLFQDMMSCLPLTNSTNGEKSGQSTTCNSYDGGDTGFLNSYFPHWYRDMPSYSRLPFGYNAQRFMHHCTYDKQPKYWDEGIENIWIVHLSSSPKPWEPSTSQQPSESIEKRKTSEIYLDGTDMKSIQSVKKCGILENMWLMAYQKSQLYYMEKRQKQLPSSTGGAKRSEPMASLQSIHRTQTVWYKIVTKNCARQA